LPRGACLRGRLRSGRTCRRRGDPAKAIAERYPELPKIDEISKTPIPGLYVIRFGADLYYTDEQGNHLIEGTLIETKTRTNPHRGAHRQAVGDRLREPAAQDAIVWKQGTGARKLVVFADRTARTASASSASCRA
jgi:thiol:disulfide interchange protein DsbC